MPARGRKLWPGLHRRRPEVVLLAVIIAAAVAYLRWRSPTAPAGSDLERYDNQTARCIKVVDGDTLHIDIPDGAHDYTKVRLWGVDTPEIAHGDQPEMYFGVQAAEFARSLVQDKPVRIVLVPAETRDRYQRLLAYVYHGRPEEMLNEELLQSGHAYADWRFGHPWKERFRELEKRAQKEKAGLWAKIRPEQMPKWRQK